MDISRPHWAPRAQLRFDVAAPCDLVALVRTLARIRGEPMAQIIRCAVMEWIDAGDLESGMWDHPGRQGKLRVYLDDEIIAGAVAGIEWNHEVGRAEQIRRALVSWLRSV
jgi:hypothetical protein